MQVTTIQSKLVENGAPYAQPHSGLLWLLSFRSDGHPLARFVVDRLRRRGDDVELVDAKAVNLPMLDRMYKEYPKGEAPQSLEQLARRSTTPTVSYSSPASTIGVSSLD